MIKRIRFLVFLLIPLFLFLVSFTLKDFQGQYFTNYKYDPSYVYLISSLNLTQFSSVKHIDHPGTPLQVLGAAVIKLSYLFSSEYNSTAEDVLMNPEKYLNEINFTLLSINCLGLFLLGAVSYKVYSDVLVSVLLQLTPFTSINIINSLTLVRPENFLFFVVCIFITGLIITVNDQNYNNRKYRGHIIFLGIVSGIGLATKLTFFPLILIPFILFRSIRSKLLFVVIFILSFLLFVLPVVSIYNINFFGNWIYKLFIHSGIYGRGDRIVVDPNSFFLNINKIFTKEWVFALGYLSICVSLILSLLINYRNGFWKFNNANKNEYDYNLKESDIGLNDRQLRLAFGIILAMTLQILIVSKHYAIHYMFPSLEISVFAILTSVSILSNSSGRKLAPKTANTIYLILIISIIVYGSMLIYDYGSQLKHSTEESEKLISYIENNSQNSVVVSTKLVSSNETALFAGITYAKNEVKNYKSILNTAYPRSIIYYDNRMYSFGDDDKIENIYKSADKILLVCTEDISVNHFLETLRNIYHIENPTIEKMFSNKNGEIVYEIRFVQS